VQCHEGRVCPIDIPQLPSPEGAYTSIGSLVVPDIPAKIQINKG